ncbi:MAG: class I SAM-dependent methyltransferase [Candidatus Omnitrophica bacterium]|nr:class I SAM-dependent methyltransferase [Candidatus Omnitrophota bacterium]
MIKKIYRFFHRQFSKPDERGEYSAGRWQDMVRVKVLELCKEARGSLIDIGCGEGLFLAKLARANKDLKIFGIDIWDKILDKARARLLKEGFSNIELKIMDIAKMDFQDDFFDTLVCINVFFNLDEKTFLKSLNELTRICRKGGRIIFDIRNKSNILLWFKYKLARYYDQTVKNLPLKTYSLKKASLLFKNKGFKINKVIPIGFPKGRFSPIFVIEAVKS